MYAQHVYVCVALCVQLCVRLVICMSVQTKMKGLCVCSCVRLHVHLTICLPGLDSINQASFFPPLTNVSTPSHTTPGKTQGHQLSPVPPWEQAGRTGRLIVHLHLEPGPKSTYSLSACHLVYNIGPREPRRWQRNREAQISFCLRPSVRVYK